VGAVYRGALTSTGNTPDVMVAAIAHERGIRMPGFFGDVLWPAASLVPLFVRRTISASGTRSQTCTHLLSAP
jgi:Na+/H+ antiporter NhaD/arsenite permease-like protein